MKLLMEDLSFIVGVSTRAFFNVLTIRSILDIPKDFITPPEGWEVSFFDDLRVGAGPFNKCRFVLFRIPGGHELEVEVGVVTHPEHELDGGPDGPPTPPAGSGYLEAKAA